MKKKWMWIGALIVAIGFWAAKDLFKKKEMKTAIPFGPYLALGAILYFLIGQSLGQMYIQLFLPDLV